MYSTGILYEPYIHADTLCQTGYGTGYIRFAFGYDMIGYRYPAGGILASTLLKTRSWAKELTQYIAI